MPYPFKLAKNNILQYYFLLELLTEDWVLNVPNALSEELCNLRDTSYNCSLTLYRSRISTLNFSDTASTELT